MHWFKSVSMIEAHAEKEVSRVVTDGVIDVPGTTMVDKIHYMKTDGKALR